MLFFNFIILLLDPDPDPAGSEKVGSVTSLLCILEIIMFCLLIFAYSIIQISKICFLIIRASNLTTCLGPARRLRHGPGSTSFLLGTLRLS